MRYSENFQGLFSCQTQETKAQGYDLEITLSESENEHRECETATSAKASGWMNYFQLADAQRWTQGVDRWIRRRIRQLLWKTWKKVKTRIRALVKLGADANQAYY